MILIRSISILFAIFLLLSCQEKKNKKTMDTSKAPMVKVIDTDFSKGSLNFEQELSLEDMSKFHGHLCDGLIVGYLGLNEALKKLYPNGIVD